MAVHVQRQEGWEHDKQHDSEEDGIMSPDDESGSNYGKIGCIVPHRTGVHGCLHSRYRKCYFCPQNPFYEVKFQEQGPTTRMDLHSVNKYVVPIGSSLLLSMESEELTDLISQGGSGNNGPNRNVRIGGRNYFQSRKKRRVVYDMIGNCIRRGGDNGMYHNDSSDGSQDETLCLHVRLDISRNLTQPDGMIYVTFETRVSINMSAVDIRGIYVKSSDLSSPGSRGDLDKAIPYIII